MGNGKIERSRYTNGNNGETARGIIEPRFLKFIFYIFFFQIFLTRVHDIVFYTRVERITRVGKGADKKHVDISSWREIEAALLHFGRFTGYVWSARDRAVCRFWQPDNAEGRKGTMARDDREPEIHAAPPLRVALFRIPVEFQRLSEYGRRGSRRAWP